LVHAERIRSFDKVRRPPVTAEQVLQLSVSDSGQQRGIVDLISVQMKDRKHSPIVDGVQKLVDVPRSGERAGFGLPVPDHRRDDQVGIIESRAARMGKYVTQFAALVDRPWCLRSAVTANSAGK